jgi:hypothetical protein
LVSEIPKSLLVTRRDAKSGRGKNEKGKRMTRGMATVEAFAGNRNSYFSVLLVLKGQNQSKLGRDFTRPRFSVLF